MNVRRSPHAAVDRDRLAADTVAVHPAWVGAIAFDFDPTIRGFRFAVEGGAPAGLPLLDPQLFRVWLRSYARIEPSLRDGLARSQTLRDWLAATNVAEDQLVNALLAYDQAGVIGDRAAAAQHLQRAAVGEYALASEP